MAIPDFQSIMLPLLKFCADEKQHNTKETVEFLSNEFNLTDEERSRLRDNAKQSIFLNRVQWAKWYLSKALLLEYPKRGIHVISKRGIQVLKDKPSKITLRYLFDNFKEFRDFRENNKEDESGVTETEKSIAEKQTPEEIFEESYRQIRSSLANEILENIKSCSPDFFERLVLEVLVAMGYGGSFQDAAEKVGKSGDEGIDGIIKEDKLGLDVIYIQAKRWQGVVGRPEIHKFVGALLGKRARKGVFITTSGFTKDAKEYAENLESKVILINGNHLANLMIDHNVGVSKVTLYEIKRIDNDYFSEE